MEYTFVNGNARQKSLWAEAAHHFLNFPFDAIGLSVEVKFVDPGEVTNQGHSDLAITTSTYGSSSSKTIVRNNAPGFGTQAAAGAAQAAAFGVPYSTERFYMETSAHELGHAAFAALSAAARLAVVRLFGLNSDDPAVLSPPDTPWDTHVAEAIAETFKEAFLPARYRVFPNRTKRRLSYRLYPAFRAIFRGSGTGGFTYKYFSDDFIVDLTEWGLDELPYHQSDRDDEAFVEYEAELEGKKTPDCFGVDMSQFPESSHYPYSIEIDGGISS